MVENSVHRASHVIPQAHARSTVTLHQPLAGLPLALAREAGRLGERGSFEPNMGAARRGGGSLLVGRQTPAQLPGEVLVAQAGRRPHWPRLLDELLFPHLRCGLRGDRPHQPRNALRIVGRASAGPHQLAFRQ
jgi:hypothetical protein